VVAADIAICGSGWRRSARSRIHKREVICRHFVSWWHSFLACASCSPETLVSSTNSYVVPLPKTCLEDVEVRMDHRRLPASVILSTTLQLKTTPKTAQDLEGSGARGHPVTSERTFASGSESPRTMHAGVTEAFVSSIPCFYPWKPHRFRIRSRLVHGDRWIGHAANLSI